MVLHCQFYLWMMSDALLDILIQDQEQASIHQTHAYYDSLIDITNQEHSTPCTMSSQLEDTNWVHQFRSRR